MRLFLYVFCGLIVCVSGIAQTAPTKARADRARCEALMYVAEKKKWIGCMMRAGLMMKRMRGTIGRLF